MFKKRFLADSKKYDENIHGLIVFDAKRLFTSINTTRTISEILKIVYKNPNLYFKEWDEDGHLLPFPDRSNLRKFLHNVLQNFNANLEFLGKNQAYP